MSGKHLPDRIVPFHSMSAQQRKDAYNACQRRIERLHRIRAHAVRLNLPGIRELVERRIQREQTNQTEVYTS